MGGTLVENIQKERESGWMFGGIIIASGVSNKVTWDAEGNYDSTTVPDDWDLVRENTARKLYL